MAKVYQVVVGDRAKRSGLSIVHTNVKGQENAINKAKKFHEEHPNRYVGVIETRTIHIFKAMKPRS